VQSVGGTPFENWLWTLLRCHGPEDVNICWCLSATSQDGWKPSLLALQKPQEVARCLLKEIIPQFGMPMSIEWTMSQP
jgi:hypothetical protein